MARASTQTLLSLDRYARIMGINPMHFNSALTPSLATQVMPDSGCDSVWYQHDWQDNDKVSREALAMAISEAEREIADQLNFWPAPYYVAAERHPYIRPYLRETIGIGINNRFRSKSTFVKYCKVVDVGRRAVSLTGTATTAGGQLQYLDLNTDLFYETARITFAVSGTDKCAYKIYFAGHSGEPEWEITDPKLKTLSAGVLTVEFESWKLINPTLWEAYPTSNGVYPVDISTVANFVTSVEIYLEYTDKVQPSSIFWWESIDNTCIVCGGTGCSACAALSQDGCAFVRDSNIGELSALPSSYDATTNSWTAVEWTAGFEPDYVDFYYISGDQSNKYLQGRTCDPLSDKLANAIAWLATSRLDRPLCSCGRSGDLAESLQEDLSKNLKDVTYFFSPEVLNNPFGPKRGEVMAWNIVSKSHERISNHVAVIS